MHNVVDFLDDFFDKNLPSDTSTSSYNDADTTLPNQHQSGSMQSPSQLSAGERSKALLSTEASYVPYQLRQPLCYHPNLVTLLAWTFGTNCLLTLCSITQSLAP